mgnify:CR=1 FL=1
MTIIQKITDMSDSVLNKRKISGKKQKPNMAKNNGEVDTSMGKYYLENKLVKKLNIRGEVV